MKMKKTCFLVSAFALFFNLKTIQAADIALSPSGRPFITMASVCKKDSFALLELLDVMRQASLQCTCYLDDSVQIVITDPIYISGKYIVFAFMVKDNACLEVFGQKEVTNSRTSVHVKKIKELYVLE